MLHDKNRKALSDRAHQAAAKTKVVARNTSLIAKRHGGRAWAWIKHHVAILFWIGMTLGVVLLGALIIWIATLKVPTLDTFADRAITSSTKIYDRTGEIVLYDVHENVKRTVVSGEQISPILKQAIVAIEDKDFYQHNGVKISATIRGGLSQFLPFINSSGGSTITQQLVKNTLLTQKVTLSRKVKEWVLAVKLEQIMDKEQILTLYLNEAPYGGTIYGVEEAARAFFGKSALDLTLPEAAYMAAIPNAPSLYSPYGRNRTRLDARKNLVLKEMLQEKMITQEEHDEARATVVEFKPQQDTHGRALHFVEYVRQQLESKYGEEVVLSGGLQVITTIDAELQELAEEVILENALENEEAYGATNSALVALDPKTGQILSMVGSRDYEDPDIDGMFNVTTAPRQPGSSFKPVIYGRAFEKGFQPETVVFDIPTQFGSCGAFDRSSTQPCYSPNNYDNEFLGPINLKNALAQSRNIPAVKMLWMVGLNDAVQTGKRLGLTTLDRNGDRYGLTLVLGGGEVSLLDLTSVYGVFANEGVRNAPTGILEVRDMDGTVLEQFTPKPEQVMDANATRKLSDVLSDNVARTPLFGANSFFNFGGRDVAGKTGTTNDNKDAWVLGYAPNIAVGVWTGNNDNTPMKKGSAISGPAWRAYMDAALAKLPAESFREPDIDPDYYDLAPVLRGQWAGGESFFIDEVSGKLATELTPVETRKEIVIPNPHSILYWIDPSNPRGARPADPERNSQFNRWEATVQSWIANNPGRIPPVIQRPSQEDDVHTEQNRPVVTIVSPNPSGTPITISQNSAMTVQVSTQSRYPVTSFDYFLNGQFIGRTMQSSYTFIPADSSTVMPGINTLKVVAVDSVYNRGEVGLVVNIE